MPPDYLMRVFFPVVVEKQWDLCLDFILSPLRPSFFFVKVSRLILGADAVPGGIGSVWGAGNLSERFHNSLFGINISLTLLARHVGVIYLCALLELVEFLERECQ